MRSADLALHRSQPPLTPQGSLLQVEGDAVLTSLRQIDGGIEARLFNPTTAATTVALRWGNGVNPQRVELVDFESNSTGEMLPTQDNASTLTLGPKQIVTVRVG